MREENIYFLRSSELCKGPILTCSPSDTVADVARKMSEKNVSSVFVCEDGIPIGVITDRDLRNKVVPSAADPREIRAGGIMSAPLVTVGKDDCLFEAVYKMSKHNIHRIAVVDGARRLAGVITDSDLLKLQTNTPQYLIRDLEHAESLEELRKINLKVAELVVHLSRTGVKTVDLVRLISHINDTIALRLVQILRAGEFPDLPGGFAFVVLGSEGRREQTLKTDQDNAIVYADAMAEADKRALEAFSVRLIDSLIAIGVPPCPGGIMAKNEFWRQSLSTWTERVNQWTSTPTPENILNFSMFSDVRLLHGDGGLVASLGDHLRRRARDNAVFMAHMAKNILRFPPPVGWFGRLRVEKSGEHPGELDIKKAAIFAITEGVKLLALNADASGQGTWERIDQLAEAKELSADEALELRTHYNYLVYLRLRSQVDALSTGKKPSDYLNPLDLNLVELKRLKAAFAGVSSFQSLLKLKFKLDFISR